MKCENFKNDLVSLAFGEIDKDREEQLKAHLKECSACRRELKELKKTTKVLSEWADEETSLRYVFMKKESFFTKTWHELAWPKKIALSAFSAALVLFFILSLAHTTISHKQGTWQISLGIRTEKNIDNSPQIAQALHAYQNELLTLVSGMIEDSESHQQKITNYKLVRLADHFDRARQADFTVLGQELNGLHRNTQGQLEQTNKVINGLIQFAAYQYKK